MAEKSCPAARSVPCAMFWPCCKAQPDAHLSHARVVPCTAPVSGSLVTRMHKRSTVGRREREGQREGESCRGRQREGERETWTARKSCPSARSVPCAEGERVLRGRGRGAEGDRGKERGRGCEGETCRRQGSLAHWKATNGVAHAKACTRTIYCNMHIHTYRHEVITRFALCVAAHVMDRGGHVVMRSGP